MRTQNYFKKYNDSKELIYNLKSKTPDDRKNELMSLLGFFMSCSKDEKIKYMQTVLELLIEFPNDMNTLYIEKILKQVDSLIIQESPDSASADLYHLYLSSLFYYLLRHKESLNYKYFLSSKSLFFRILEEIENKNTNIIDSYVVNDALSIFCPVLANKKIKDEVRSDITNKLNGILNLIFSEKNIKILDYFWYFEINKIIPIFRDNHLAYINAFYHKNPNSDSVGKYLEFIESKLEFIKSKSADMSKKTKDVIKRIAARSDSDIIRGQAIKLLNILEEHCQDYIVEESIKIVDNDTKLVEQASSIIDRIRADLTVRVKDLKTIGSFGHYTTIDTLTNFLIKPDQCENTNNHIQSPYLRLTHSKQLNDPMEGKVIYDFLSLGYTSPQTYQNSNVFLSSLTVVSDSLPMWKEYADESKGAFLEYDKAYLEQIVAHESIEFVKIHYLNINDDNSKSSDFIDEKLNKLKTIVKKLKKNNAEKQLNRLTKELSKISYLFKVNDYAHEMEYRILINFDDASVKKIIEKDEKDLLNEKNFRKEEIGLQIFDKDGYNDFRKYIMLVPKENGRYGLFVYINLVPLKYSKVKLGPKVTDADYIAPYLKLVSKDLDVELSQIPYR